MPEQPGRIPDDSSPHSPAWLERRREPIRRPRLVEHLFRNAVEPAAPPRGHGDKLAEAERELEEQTAKLAEVEEELQAVKELVRARAQILAEPTEASVAAASHLLFIPEPTGYALLEAPGESPPAGSEIQLGEDGSLFVVSRVARSPLPHDRRRCAYLLHLA